MTVFAQGSHVASSAPTARLWEMLYLFTQSSFYSPPHVPVMWLMRDKTTEERGNTNGNISSTVHEKGKWEKREHDKENRKFARNEGTLCRLSHEL